MARWDMVRHGTESWVWFDLARCGMARFGMDFKVWPGLLWWCVVCYGMAR